ncbi:MAG: hypothetical protein UW92_C0014G0013 [Candidatus Jorgensenbacteria bacterium GW2011_GWA2_45_13]|uniref:Uncharacterized protein n=1 Tax=Candidatus Jorgensenbacteria bacterium GW2011_GWA2_45_13 TaxID=1618662 RepID=A0A0G1L689_9BACT|nr:MAG: hypothetical protein UW92_C0014G0013 [Candidatus Jorgensenbacteria bacterium GW2011_GWA2_45_13]HIH29877.1 hypothetical protein [Candidatus Micrarchaeota archaeon]
MACFLVPTIIGIAVEKGKNKIPKHYHAGWLSAMIFGGAAALTVEHMAHNEIVPWPPFLTAMATPADTAAMLGEMVAVGIPMTIALIAVWAVLVVAYNKLIAARNSPASAVASA